MKLSPRVILVTGAPGSGKSLLATVLSRRLRVPFLARDQVRGGLLFTGGAWTDSIDHFATSDEAVQAFLATIETLLGQGVTCIAEYVVRAHRPEDFDRLIAAGDVVVIKTACAGAIERFADRHRRDRLIANTAVLEATGHDSVDSHTAAAVERMLQVESEMMTTFPVPTLEVDTTDGHAPSLDEIIDFVTRPAR